MPAEQAYINITFVYNVLKDLGVKIVTSSDRMQNFQISQGSMLPDPLDLSSCNLKKYNCSIRVVDCS